MNTQLTVALIGGVVVLLGHLLSNFLDRRRTLRLKETEFKIARYQEFLSALSAYGSNRTYDAQLDFVKSLNVISLMGSERVLKQVNALVENYNSPEGTADASWTIINRIIFEMRSDVGGKRASQVFADFEFPIIVTDISPDRSKPKKTHDSDKAGGSDKR
jgi:hypothetical protein